MSKNLTRKGIAFGALVALGTTLFAGVPASAVTPLESAITTSNAHGTGFTVIEGTDFEVTTTIASDYAYFSNTGAGTSFTSTPTNLYNVCSLWSDNYYDSADHADFCVSTTAWELSAAEALALVGAHVENSEFSVGIVDTVAADSADAEAVRVTNRWTSTTGKLKWAESSTSAYVDTYSDSGASFATADIATDTTTAFTPYLDLNGNSIKEANEPSGQATTVTFANNNGTLISDVLSTSVVTATTAAVNYTVTAPAGFNIAQMSDDLEIRLYKAAHEETDPNFESDGTGSFGTLGVGYYTSRVFLDGDSTAPAYSALSNQVIVGQVSTDSEILDIELVDQADANVTTNEDIREGTKSVSVKTQLTTTAGAAYAKSGVSVKFYVTAGSNAVDTVLKVNNVALSSITDGTVVTTNADGIAEITVTTNTGTVGDDFDVYAVVLTTGGSANSGIDCSVVNYEWIDAVAKNIYETHDTDTVLGTTKGSTVTLNYEVTDNFGQPLNLPGESFRIVVSDGHHHTLVSVPALVVNGKASVSYIETRNAGETYDVDAELQRSLDGSNWYRDVHCIEEPETDIVVGTTLTVGGVSAVIDQTPTYQINTSTFANVNWNVVRSENTLLAPSDANEVEVRGVVVDANNVPIAGAPVQISLARGGMFEIETDDNEIYTTSAATVYTNANGAYYVEFVTHYAGVNSVNVTAGGKTAVASATVAYPTSLNSTDVLSLVGPSAVASGTATPISVRLFDKFGNGIQGATIALSLTGEGYLSAPSVVLANGVATVTLINGVADTAVSTIIATSAHSTPKTIYKNIATGAQTTLKAGSKSITVNVKNARGQEIRVFVDGKRVALKVANSNDFTFKVKSLKAGKRKVTVTSDYRNLVTKKVVTVKK